MAELITPYTKPNNEISYIQKDSNHPQSVIRQVPLSIKSRLRLSSLSENKKEFQEALPLYQKTLQNSGYIYNLTYKSQNNNDNSVNISKIKRNKNRQIIWFNPPLNLEK